MTPPLLFCVITHFRAAIQVINELIPYHSPAIIDDSLVTNLSLHQVSNYL